ncbi:flagellar hook-associated protein 3 [Tabrizicola sp. TH137]|uniref:flagellar hook-associated protein FlgL n=1 Tax=Tabrizicola sp. TH137 TaxID=2067452 RepID=UPI000C797853|nr:flagellar hook-associated protein FlgL [Tabrizicola sp. TH137]PLL12116.1 flagellar hook-associated protein 3 [Tabrizicola sp. TH137]
MTASIGNALFGKITMENFNRLSGEISDLQAQISSGKNDPRPSADPMRAAKLSAVTEQRGAIERFTDNAELAADRLDQADLQMAELGNIVRAFQQISLQAANDTLTEAGFAGLRAEAVSLRTSLLTVANARDTFGLPLFAGFGSGEPFADGPDGVEYRGDGGRPTLRLTETATLATGLNGSEVFMSVPTDDGGAKSLFAMVDDLIASLTIPLQTARPFSEVNERGLFTPMTTRTPANMAFDLTGPTGTARISAEVMTGAPDEMLAAINAATPTTGVTATLSADGRGFVLTGLGDIRIGNFDQPGNPRTPVASFVALDESLQPRGTGTLLRNDAISATRLVGLFGDAITHAAAQRAEVGALGRLAEDHAAVLADRKLRIDKAVAGLEDLDVAAAITRVQQLLLTEQASQQTFVKINGSSLFDYIR